MKLTLSLLVFLFAFSTAAPNVPRADTGKSAEATYVSAADVQATVTRPPQAGGMPGVNPQPNIRVVDAGGYNVAIGALHRPQTPPGVAAVHYKVSEVYHVIDGAATLVTGGTMVNAKTRPPDDVSVKFEDGPGASGSSIQGGTSQRIKAGDLVVIPAGVPHWFSAIEGSITYVVVRVDPGRILPVK
jgi:mannose-6-phosphate isomerase-like protein (cupin superfamily)